MDGVLLQLLWVWVEFVFFKLGCIATTEWGCLLYKDDIRTLSNGDFASS